MALHYAPALTLNNLVAGYNSNADFNTLGDNQVNDGKNVEFTRVNTFKKRDGYVRMLNTALTKTGLRVDTGLSGRGVYGHFQLVKQNNNTNIKTHVVAAGPNIWNYTSATASIVMSGLKDDGRQWFFEQIMSPDDGSDDVVVGVNGIDPPIYWNGTDASATFLSSVTNSSGVQSGKFIASLFGRIYIANINDVSDVDSTSKIILSSFDSAGVPTPQIFSSELFFYVGGSDKYGGITGLAVLNGELIIFKRNATYKFTPAAGRQLSDSDIADLHSYSLNQMDENVGCIAPGSITTVGNTVLFLSEYGLYMFNGSQFKYIGGPIEQDLKNINFSLKEKAYGVFNRSKNQYWLSIAEQSVNHNNVVFVYDIPNDRFFPPYTNMRCDVMSQFENVYGEDNILCGDHQGYLYQLDRGTADGVEIGQNIVATTITSSGTVLNFDSSGITHGGDGLRGLSIWTVDSRGIVDSNNRIITDCTNTQITVSPGFGSAITTANTFILAGIDSYIRTKDYAIESPDVDKLYRQVTVRAKQLGSIDYNLNYIIDFREASRVGSAAISQLNLDYITFGVCTTFETCGAWGPAPTKLLTKNLRVFDTQPLVGKYFGLKFYNNNANEPFEIYGFDIVAKVVGRRS